MIEDFLNALHNFRTNKMRTMLSLLGIVIGVTSVVIVTTLGTSLYHSIAQQFSGFSMDVINIGAGWNPNTNSQFIEFNDAFRNSLMKQIPKIKNIFYSSEFSASVLRGALTVGKKQVEGIEPGRLEALKLEMDYGDFFSATDYLNGFQKAVIGDGIASQLFPEGNAVGKTITLQINSGYYEIPPYNFQFEVIGVLKKKNNWLMRSSESIFVPRKFYMNQLSHSGESNVWEAEVCVYDSADTSVVENEIKSIAAQIADGNYNAVFTFSAQQEFEQMSSVMNMVRLVLSSIAGISLLVGGIGIMNIMLVTVTERRKEIGIRKALGATRKAIAFQFLVESATLTLTGGTIGAALGIIISKLIFTLILPKTFVLMFSFSGTVIAFGVSVFTGVFFGLHPALKAAKLDPVEALAE